MSPRRGAVRATIDTGRLGAAASRPGIDPRVWITTATVTELGFDEEQGIFADVTYEPGGDQETSLVGTCYAGDDFGEWFPLEVGDSVLIAVPMGNTGNGPTIIARMWNGTDKPNAAFGDGEAPTSDRVLIVKPGKNYKLRTSDNGTIQFQDASQSFVRGDDQKSALTAFFNSLDTWAGLVKLGIVAGGGTLDNTAFSAAIAQVKSDLTSALSTKIKGE